MEALTRSLVLALVILDLVALSGPFMMGGMMGPGHMGPAMMGEGNWHWGMVWGLGGLTMLAFWGLLIVGVVLLIRLLDRSRVRPRASMNESPLDIVRRRYAAVERTREQDGGGRDEGPGGARAGATTQAGAASDRRPAPSPQAHLPGPV